MAFIGAPLRFWTRSNVRASMRLSATDLRCQRGGRDVFTALSFSVGAGGALAVTGANGAGKSSLLRLLAGLLPPAGGRVEFAGGEAELTLGEQAHYLGHQDALKPSLSVGENLLFWARYLGGDEARTADALGRMGLGNAAHFPAAYLSAGQRRRLALARLLVVRRPVWLLDEPQAALDAAGSAALVALLREHLAGGGVIVAATHGPLGLPQAAELRVQGAGAAETTAEGTRC